MLTYVPLGFINDPNWVVLVCKRVDRPFYSLHFFSFYFLTTTSRLCLEENHQRPLSGFEPEPLRETKFSISPLTNKQKDH